MQNEAQQGLDRKAAKISALFSNNLDKYQYLTGEDLGLKPNTIEQARFEYSPLGKILIKGQIKMIKRKDCLKGQKILKARLKAKIKRNQNQLKNEEQSELLKDESTVVDKKSKEIVLLKDKLNFIFKNFDSNFNSTGKKFLIMLANDEKKIDNNNLFFEIDDKSVAKSADFLKEIGTLYDLLIYLLDNSMNAVTSGQIQGDSFKAITTLKIIISKLKPDITDQSEEQKKENICKT